ncbi:hypothetical protein CPB83DRAFT_844368 [Crepidotus variabilis]|uniref:L domain-like protein n=1 Tax=Crepidotus variabilis TaxID=179855 RepID=A0A9P6ETG7_9AGAR|nr:hypothetical protein CPB83DRAFT_844368 [Crepidotus variabilis]
MSGAVPGWQTEELQDEWPDSEEEKNQDDEDDQLSYGTRSVSLTVPLSSQIHSTADFQPDKTPQSERSHAAGTFVVRDDVPGVPIIPKTPGRKKFFGKDFFTPLQLETMFEPPSPPTQGTPESMAGHQSIITHSVEPQSAEDESEDEIMETDMPNMNSFHGRKASLACQFTFSVPRESSPQPPGLRNDAFPQAQSTPHPPHPINTAPPTTDPRLKLFQFQYDTYTREHLSALVDSIAVNTPSGTGTGTTPTPTSFGHGLSRIVEAPPPASHLRSSKRIKLSPNADFQEAEENPPAKATISRPIRRDYVGESLSLMQQIKLARDYSTISTVASGQPETPSMTQADTPQKSRDKIGRKSNLSPPNSIRRRSLLSVPQEASNPSTSSSTINSKASSSSSTYRQKAAALMEQIKSDVKRQKRVFADDSEASHITTHVDETVTSVAGSVRSGSDGKENLRQSTSSRRASTKLNSSRASRTSPRKANKRDVDDTDLIQNLSRISIQEQRPIVNIFLNPPTINLPQLPARDEDSLQPPSNLAPPQYPSIRLTTNDDLNRFVSSSTASGTTLTAGSVPSFTKHSGPAHIRTIAPTDLPTLPEQFGDMLFDKVMMRWVKNTARAMGHERSTSHATDASEDPFGDIESLRDDSRVEQQSEEHDDNVNPIVEMSRIEEQSEVEDEEELELSNFSTDASAHIVEIMTGVETVEYEDETTDSESTNDDIHTATQAVVNDIDFDSEFEDSPSRNNLSVADLSAAQVGASLSNSTSSRSPRRSSRRSPRRPHATHHHQHQHLTVDIPPTARTPSPVPGSASGKISPAALATPNRATSVPITTPIIKSALKSNSATPTSALKNGIRSRFQTPVNSKLHRRSVSFSDGKREGPIRDNDPSVAPSVRTKRIADMMMALEESSDLDDSPSKTSSTGRPEGLQPLTSRRPSGSALGASSSQIVGGEAQSPRRVFSRTYAQRQSPGRRDSSVNAKANGTFLTECSFAIAHDRLVEVITDVQPFEPHWEQLGMVDLSNAKLESVARLKEFLPRLDTLSLNHNELAWLSGIPGSVRTLSVAFNCLTGITSYSHLNNLENLDISNNEVDSLRQLQCLRHLRELKADGNKITSLDGLERMDGLMKLSVEKNKIQKVDLDEYQWSRLEMLNISHNRIDDLQGLSSLQSLIALNMDMNSLGELLISGTMSRLRILRVSGNRLKTLDVGRVPNLRTLYADNNSLSGLANLKRLARLENLSLRNQAGRALNLLTRDVRDVKRLYLSGNPIGNDLLTEPCYNLVYLELAACRLTALPEGMARLLPNLRVLNLNYNFLEDVRPLAGLTRLQKLTIIGSRLKSTKPLIRLLGEMPDAEMLDFRMNPCTLGWYLPLLVKDVPGALQPSEGKKGHEKKGEQGWQEMDVKFRRDLPDESYIGRLAYRGLIMRGCLGLKMLDGVGVSEKERMKADKLLIGLLGRRTGSE